MQGLNFDIFDGEMVGIIGPSGAGKTSFINTLIDPDFKVDQDCIFWEGEPWDRSDICHKIGFARQFGGLMSDLTIGENLAMPLEYVLGIRSKLALELAMLNMLEFDLKEEVFYQYPHTLSGGMLKKCMFCFATIINQKIVLLDEPLSGLDPIAIKKIKNILYSLVPSRTVVCVTHHFIEKIQKYLFLSPEGYATGTLKELNLNPLSKEFVQSFAHLSE